MFSDCRVIQTGIAHGTVTVLMDSMPLEITTYRTDGEYLDHRHPVQVTFARCLEDDLSRRDFTVNAMAYHPEKGIVDLFGGIADLEKKIIRCVGEPCKRFDEDGLRILRALRFAAVLDFDICPETAQAVHECKHLLSHIAAERIREELCKLLCGKGAVRILRDYRDVIEVFLPELNACSHDAYEHLLQALSLNENSDLVTRLALLLHSITHTGAEIALVEHVMRSLRFDNATAAAVTELVRLYDLPLSSEERAVKRLMRSLSREQILKLLELRRCSGLANGSATSALLSELEQIPHVVDALLASGACLSLKMLAVKGNDLMAIGVRSGREVGELLNLLLELVLDDVLPNEKDALLAEVKKRMEQ